MLYFFRNTLVHSFYIDSLEAFYYALSNVSCNVHLYLHMWLHFDRYLRNGVAEVADKYRNDWKSLNPNLAASIIHKILW